jgi:hypothetical protein
MRTSCDESLKCFSELAKNEWNHLSEADTRSKIIDPLFTKCLNWQESDFFREEHSDNGYLDYIFKIRSRNSFVIEAKKSGQFFNIPVSYNFRRRLQIGGAISKDETIKKALKQAQGYCIAQGARFGVVTNGDQYIIFDAMNTGDKWENGYCIVFYNLDDIERHFNEFWNLLSKDAVEKNSFLELVSKEIEETTFTRPMDDVIIKNVKQPRNDLYRYITPIIEYAFQEITEPEKLDMLRECYVYDQEFDEVDKLLKNEFSLNNPLISPSADMKKIVQSKNDSGVFQKDFKKDIGKLDKDFSEPMLLLLLGTVGSGKTTFIHRFFNTVITEKEKQNKIDLSRYFDFQVFSSRFYQLGYILEPFYLFWRFIDVKLRKAVQKGFHFQNVHGT